MIVINFSHPLTEAHRTVIERLSGVSIDRVIEVKSQFDHEQPFAGQARALVDSVGLSAEEWQTMPLVVNLPALHVITAVVLAELHGRTGYFPTVVRLKPVPGSAPTAFEVTELVNLQAVRDAARQAR